MFCSKFGGECSHKVIPDDKFVFVMMPFANSDSIYDAIKHAVEAIKNKHLKCERADSRYTSRSIWCGRICNNIRKAKYIIVDTTHRNPNVFYELGFAHAMISDTKTIIITQNIKEAPFDVKDLGHIIYSEKNLPRLREDLKKIILDLEQEEKNESYENKPPDKVISDLKSQLQAEEERGSKFKKELIETEERERKLKEHIKEIEASQFTSPEVAKNKITELKGNVAELQSKLIFTEKDKKDVVEQLKKNLYEKENKLKLFEEHFKIYEKSKDIKPLSDWLFGNSRRRAEAEKWFNRAYDEAEKGNIEEAIKYYYAVIMLNPEYAVAHNNLGNLLQNLKRFEEAEKEFKEAIRLNPNDAVAHNNLGILLKNLKRFEEAEKEYKEALKINPNDAVAHNNLGILLIILNRYEEAEKEYREAIRLNPNLAVAHNNLGNLLQILNRYEEAEKEYKEALKINPNDAEAHNNLGNLLGDLNRYEEAEKEYKEAIRLNPNLAAAHQNFSKLYFVTKKYKKSLEYGEKSLQLSEEIVHKVISKFLILINLIALERECKKEKDNFLSFIRENKGYDLRKYNNIEDIEMINEWIKGLKFEGEIFDLTEEIEKFGVGK